MVHTLRMKGSGLAHGCTKCGSGASQGWLGNGSWAPHVGFRRGWASVGCHDCLREWLSSYVGTAQGNGLGVVQEWCRSGSEVIAVRLVLRGGGGVAKASQA
eukprot:7435750-Pyramimonas_sp.AAC.1